MKKKGILHPELSHLAASLGHTDYLVLADKGYPVPNHVTRINLGYTYDQPTILQVLEPLAEEITIDRIIVTHEMGDISPGRLEELKKRYPHVLFEKISHQEMKELTAHAKGVVKTGDACPYANLIVVSG
ncbi:D-ribose pyranase [Neobacillus kokaensis]|uniref:D-ribose pyranase n=1 Tax=Neobacillus kokaensis TaxID=2759023 RepID=A0ABQ3N143_9BACI|nr:D-ribose pyranase [Neobacillus kokaensis]GHH97831.1 D-ribose pyranase [Neobacillus kokaensis]